MNLMATLVVSLVDTVEMAAVAVLLLTMGVSSAPCRVVASDPVGLASLVVSLVDTVVMAAVIVLLLTVVAPSALGRFNEDVTSVVADAVTIALAGFMVVLMTPDAIEDKSMVTSMDAVSMVGWAERRESS